MGELTIVVNGTSQRELPAERVTVRLRVAADGPERDPVVNQVRALHAETTAQVEQLHDSGAVSWWSSDQLRAWGDRPWSNDGAQLPLVHHAAVEVLVRFVDFTALGQWLTETAAVDAIAVAGLHWELEEATTEELTAQVQTAAVHDAVARATRYAAALGHEQVEAVEITEPSDLSQPRMMAMSVRDTGGSGGGAAIELRPEDVTVRASVTARFRVLV
ncbi:MAG TPA: SIMPL domain-containing protein [Candidatus Avipropionibacterium avicola]|uniref:SIMPL domain-containing protein n=1 Tax=Candidatus Avipropionibacterium avicola TaxID=2840701 RepID=A0A9D1GZI8_9ACTN|nr:SIMPL domain-containing protein [Candidatus Avipropionibacterium avicola]